MGEPPLPLISDYSKAKLTSKRSPRGGRPKPSLCLVGRIGTSAIEDTQLALGIGATFRKPWCMGMRRLKSMVAVSIGLENEEDIKPWIIMRKLEKSPHDVITALEAIFPTEGKSIEELACGLKLSNRKSERVLGKKLETKNEDWALVLYDFVLGLESDPDNVTILVNGVALAENMERRIRKLPDDKLPIAWKNRRVLKRNSTKARLRAHQYRTAAKSMASQLAESNQVVVLLSRLVCGAERMSDVLDARRDEIEAGFKKNHRGFGRRIERREWGIVNGKMVENLNDGPPWPPHFDPISVFGVLAAGGVPEPPRDETILARLTRVIRPRRLERELMLQENLIAQSQPAAGKSQSST